MREIAFKNWDLVNWFPLLYISLPKQLCMIICMIIVIFSMVINESKDYILNINEFIDSGQFVSEKKPGSKVCALRVDARVENNSFFSPILSLSAKKL